MTWPDRWEEANLAINAGTKSVRAPQAPPKVFWLRHGMQFDQQFLYIVMGAVADCGSAIDAIGWGPGSAWRHAIMDRAQKS